MSFVEYSGWLMLAQEKMHFWFVSRESVGEWVCTANRNALM
jgi:hypothetical protein